MPTKEKAMILFLAVAGVFVFAFGALSFNKNVKKPFLLKSINLDAILDQDKALDITKDTDLDGLTDFDELNLYFTSAYLEDTDSDGKLDSEEIETGTDPNCPEGKECGVEPRIVESDEFDLFGDLGIEQDLQSFLFENEVAPDNSLNLLDSAGAVRADLPPEEIRAILRAGGIEDEMLKNLSDSDIAVIYQESLKSLQGLE